MKIEQKDTIIDQIFNRINQIESELGNSKDYVNGIFNDFIGNDDKEDELSESRKNGDDSILNEMFSRICGIRDEVIALNRKLVKIREVLSKTI